MELGDVLERFCNENQLRFFKGRTVQDDTLRRSDRRVLAWFAERNNDVQAGIACGIGVAQRAVAGTAASSTASPSSRRRTRCGCVGPSGPTSATSLAGGCSREINVDSGRRFGEMRHHHHSDTLALE